MRSGCGGLRRRACIRGASTFSFGFPHSSHSFSGSAFLNLALVRFHWYVLLTIRAFSLTFPLTTAARLPHLLIPVYRSDPEFITRVTPKERARMKKQMKLQAAWDAKAALRASSSSASASSFDHPNKQRDGYGHKDDRNFKHDIALSHGFDETEQSEEEALIEWTQAWASAGASRGGGGSTGKADVQTGELRRVGLKSSRIRGDP